MHHVIQPSKEQVRAYMLRREGARRPPPAPEEVRRQLGWHLAAGPQVPLHIHLYFAFPAAIGQLATLMVWDWIFTSLPKK
ncbi:MAG: hypothetical protein V4582_21510 [Pseudomonadota bacterium]